MLDESKLVFILGQPRSGTTMLQKVLDNSTEIESPEEPWVSLVFLSLLNKDIHLSADYDFDLARDAVRHFLDSGIGINEYENLVKRLILSVYAQKDGDKLFVEKTPRNYFVVDDIYKLFPNAKYIILKRNPLDVFSSILSTWHNDNILATKSHWHDIFFALEQISRFEQYAKNTITVYYEELAENPDMQLRTIEKFLGLKNPLKNQYETDSHRFGDPTGIHRDNKIFQGSIFKYKNSKPEKLSLLHYYLDELGDIAKGFFRDTEEYNQALVFLSGYKSALDKRYASILFEKPKKLEEQLAEKEKEILLKEQALQELSKSLLEKEAVIQELDMYIKQNIKKS